jgi:hypothetical protein
MTTRTGERRRPRPGNGAAAIRATRAICPDDVMRPDAAGRMSEARYRRYVDYLITGAADDTRHQALIDWIATRQLERATEDGAFAEVAARARALATTPTHAEIEHRRSRVVRPRGIADVDFGGTAA